MALLATPRSVVSAVWHGISHSQNRLSVKRSIHATCRAAKSDSGSADFGMFVCSGSPAVAEALSYSGLDWLCIDCQHGAVSYESLSHLLMATSAGSAKRIVRVQGPSDRAGIQQALDLGADGVMVPLINNRQEALQAVSFCRFPPRGIRSVAYPTRAVYKYGVGVPALAQYLQSADSQVEVWLQVETKECLDNVDDVLSVEGVDCAFLGPADMSFSMNLHVKYDYNLPATLSSPETNEVYIEVLKACQRHGVQPGVFCLGKDKAMELRRLGYTKIAYDVDLNVLVSHAQSTLRAMSG